MKPTLTATPVPLIVYPHGKFASRFAPFRDRAVPAGKWRFWSLLEQLFRLLLSYAHCPSANASSWPVSRLVKIRELSFVWHHFARVCVWIFAARCPDSQPLFGSCAIFVWVGSQNKNCEQSVDKNRSTNVYLQNKRHKN